MSLIILTGGGTAGHVNPNLALVPELEHRGYTVEYIGSYKGPERSLVSQAGLTYYAISSGKLRRYFSLKTFVEPFFILRGYFQAKRILKLRKPALVFSKGGYVSAPVVWAARRLKIPVIIHESDVTPGLANKLCYSSAHVICCSFPQTLDYLPKGKTVLTGNPIRTEILNGSRQKGLAFTGLSGNKPILLVVGGSGGSEAINKQLWAILPELLETFDVVHICGPDKKDESVRYPGYVQYGYINDEMNDLIAMADVVLSRAGANMISELLGAKKATLLIPYGSADISASRGDQIRNAKLYQTQGYSDVLMERDMNDTVLLERLMELYRNRKSYEGVMSSALRNDAIRFIVGKIDEVVQNEKH